ncbi:FAD-binding monooxygenase [Pisolithus marmoratus]|nr:FAD-binding monooxygenase [Pisolithus marmoratus]
MTTCTTPVLVVGAGPTGLVAALTLARNNVPVRIIEKEPQHRRGQRGTGIQPRTFEVFHFLHVPEIHERAAFLPWFRHTTKARSNLCIRSPWHPTWNQHRRFHIITSKPWANLSSGQSCANTSPGSVALVELGTRLVSFTQDERCVKVKVAKHRDNGEEVEEDMEVAYLVRADGARGVTRKQLGLSFLGTTREDIYMVLGDIRLDVKGLDRDHWHFFGSTPQDMITFRPFDDLGKDGWQFIMASRTVDLKSLVEDEGALVNCMQDFSGLGDDVKVKEMMWVSDCRPNMRMVNKFGVGRIFVAGDAAHVHSPTGGQSSNSGIQDAFNIAWKIALAYKGLSPASLLDTYTAERLPVITECSV